MLTDDITKEKLVEEIERGRVWWDISPILMTDEIWIFYWETRGYDIRDLPEHLITYERCVKSVSDFHRASFMLKWIPEKFLDRNLCKIAVQYNGMGFCDIPDDIKDKDLFEIAKQTWPRIVKFQKYNSYL